MNDELNPSPDLTDRETVAQLLRDDVQVMRQQANASGSRPSAMAGHPFPEMLYNRIADHLAAAAALLAQPAAPAVVPPKAPTVPPVNPVITGAEWNDGAPAPERPNKQPKPVERR